MPMKRTSLFLEDKVMRAVSRIAERRGVSVATIVREAIAAYVATPSDVSPLPSVAGRYGSGKRDTSSKVDELLWHKPHA